MKKLLDRFKEPSSYAGLAAILTAIGIQVDGDILQAGTYILAGIAGVVAVLLKEKTPE